MSSVLIVQLRQPEIAVRARRMSIGAWSSAREAQACGIATGFALGLMLASAAAKPVVAPPAVRIAAGPARSSLYVSRSSGGRS